MDAIAEAWEDVEHQDRKAASFCITCHAECKNTLGAEKAETFKIPAVFICLQPPYWTLCQNHGTYALIAGWEPVKIDSASGRAELKLHPST